SEERARSPLAVKLHVALHGHQRDAEGPRDLALGRVAVDHQLAAEEPEGRQIVAVVDEYRKVAVEVGHRPAPTFEGNLRRDLGGAFGEYGELDLRHPPLCPPPRKKSVPSDDTEHRFAAHSISSK